MNTSRLRRRPPVSPVEATPVPSDFLELPAGDVPVVDDVQDPAEQAEQARQAAANARSRAAAAVAEAQAEAQRLVEAAQAEASRLEREARAADAEAVEHQAVADRQSAIVRTAAEVETLTAARDRLAGDAGALGAEVGRLDERLAELAAEQAEASQRRVMAVRADDASGLRDALTALATAAELSQARTADRSAAQSRLESVRAEHGEVCKALGRASLRLLALRREEAGLPPVEEVVEVALAALPMLVTSMAVTDAERLAQIMLAAVPAEGRAEMAEAISLGRHDPHGLIALASTAAGAVLGPQIISSLQQLALDAPDEYEGVRRLVMAPGDPVPVRHPMDDAVGMIASVLAGGAR